MASSAGSTSQMLVRRSSSRSSSGIRDSTSPTRYSATGCASPENAARNASGSACPRSGSVASRRPAAHPPVRACSSAACDGVRRSPHRASSSAASSGENRSCSARSSHTRSSSRRRATGSAGSARPASTSRSPLRAARASARSPCRTSGARRWWVPSRTSRTGTGRVSRPSRRSSRKSSPTAAREAVRRHKRLDGGTAGQERRAASTPPHSLRGSSSSSSSASHAVGTSLFRTQSARTSVLPYPGGAHTRVSGRSRPLWRMSERTGRATNSGGGTGGVVFDRGTWTITPPSRP